MHPTARNEYELALNSLSCLNNGSTFDIDDKYSLESDRLKKEMMEADTNEKIGFIFQKIHTFVCSTLQELVINEKYNTIRDYLDHALDKNLITKEESKSAIEKIEEMYSS